MIFTIPFRRADGSTFLMVGCIAFGYSLEVGDGVLEAVLCCGVYTCALAAIATIGCSCSPDGGKPSACSSCPLRARSLARNNSLRRVIAVVASAQPTVYGSVKLRPRERISTQAHLGYTGPAPTTCVRLRAAHRAYTHICCSWWTPCSQEAARPSGTSL